MLKIPTRSLNHFHDPTKPLAQAGLKDTFSGMSAIVWAQDPADQANTTGGNWSWQMVRDHEYNYLTSLSTTEEEANLARMLKGLGYQMHLLQDMSQPNHVRNDTHISDGMGYKTKNGFETWAKDKPKAEIVSILSSAAAQRIISSVSVALTSPYESGLSPVARLFDTRDNLIVDQNVPPQIPPYIVPSTSFSQGLAEYTNTNYFSEDSFFAAERFPVGEPHYFPFPQKAETDLQQFIDNNLPTIPIFDFNKTYQSFVIGKKTTRGEPLNCLAKPDWNTADLYRVLGEGRFFYGSFIQDENCYQEQASNLLPRAVGYSAAMLDYFFRGDLTATVPVDTPPTASKIRLNIHNSTPSGETMDGGSIELIAIFRQYSTNGTATSGVLIPNTDFQFRKYTVLGCTRSDPKCAIDKSDNTFDFYPIGDPIPPLASDISLVIVYRGTLGKEQDAVAFTELSLGRLGGDINLSLPSRGVYAAASGDSLSNTFSDFAIAARNTSTTAIGPGTNQVLVTYQQAQGDPFLSQPVNTAPSTYYTSATIPDQGISSITANDLLYSLSTGIPVTATDVYVYLIHTDSNGKVTYGYRDISEPTPADVFNNADKICINNQWYSAGSTEAIALADSNGNGIPDIFDPYAHNIANIFGRISELPAAASATDYTFASPALLAGGSFRRLGYILTDYSFNYSLLENWQNVSGDDLWEIIETADQYPGIAVKNQTDADGTYYYPGMYSIRGNKMWWGAGVIYDNDGYPANSSCDWSTLP